MELALCAIADEDWTAAATLSADAEEMFRGLGETSNVAFMQAIRSTALMALGRPDEAWALRAQSFAIQSAEGRSNRLPTSVGEAARAELRNGRLDASRALLNLEESVFRAAREDVELSNVLVRAALIETTLGNGEEASRNAQEAMTVARRIADPALHERAVADARFAAGAAALPSDPRRARELLSQAIDQYRATKNAFYVAQACLLRARSSSRLGETNDALSDLEDGIAGMERHRSVVAGVVLGSVFDARPALYEEIGGDDVPTRDLRRDRPEVAGTWKRRRSSSRRRQSVYDSSARTASSMISPLLAR